MNLGIKFNAKAFGRAFIGKKASRFIPKLFDGIGHDNLSYMIRMDRDVLEYVSAEDIERYRQAIYAYADIADIAAEFTDDEVYSWIPKEQKAFIESHVGGKRWVMRQMAQLRKAAFGSST